MTKQNLFLTVSLMVVSIVTTYSLNGVEPRSDELAIIEVALLMTLPKTDVGENSVANAVVNNAFKLVWDGKYEEAFAHMVIFVEQFPRNFYVQARFASIIGDYAELFSGELKERMISYAKALFEKLKHEVAGQSKVDYFFFKNEY